MFILRRLIRGGMCATCGVVFVAILFPAMPAFGDEAAPPASSLSPEQRKAEVERLQKEVKDLRESADAPWEWMELMRIQNKFQEMEEERNKARQPLMARWNTLQNAAPVQEWGRRLNELYDRLRNLQMDDRERARTAGQRLYEARHRELEKRAATDTRNLRRLRFDALSYPRIDGSTSTLPLSILVACRFFNLPCAWAGKRTQLRYWDDGFEAYSWGGLAMESLRPEPEFQLTEYVLQAKAATPAQERLANIINRLIVTTPDTHEAYVRLIEGESEFGLLARGPSPAELDLARQRGVELETAPCALDALVFLVNEENDVKGLTTEQIRGIYSSKITRWKEVGDNELITPYQREDQSGSQELMRTLVMKEQPFMPAEGGRGVRGRQLIQQGMGGPYVALHGDKNGLAYSVYYYERYMAGSARTKTIAVDGIEPTDDSIRTRKYPFVSEVLIVTRKDLDAKAPAARLREWLLSPEGQAVVYESGYVPLPR